MRTTAGSSSASRNVPAIAYGHHEKLDGSGYPDGLKNEEISPGARIMAVVDTYDALVTDRPYRKGMPLKKAVEILKQEANSGKVDKVVVSHLIGSLRVDENKLAAAN